jgi:hypothetical protein
MKRQTVYFIGVLIIILLVRLFTGCAYTRNAPLIHLNANGNTIPVSVVP